MNKPRIERIYRIQFVLIQFVQFVAYSPRIAATRVPTWIDCSYSQPTRMPTPGSLILPIEFKPADAMQPHCEQSGLPPNWHGLTRLFRSAVIVRVVFAKMHSVGFDGGSK